MRPSERTRAVLGDTNIHLDFHTPPLQPDIGVDFDPDRFGRRLDEANVDSIALFAKCCHGMSYYDTEVGMRHPDLDFDLLAAQIEACHERDIDVLAYYVLTWDNYPGEHNPDWYQRDGEGEPLRAETREDRWEWLCLNSPYAEERVLPQVRELLEYDLDGFFFDILIYHEDACTCRYCREGMADRGLDPDSPADRQRYRTDTCKRFAARTTDLIKADDEDRLVVYNHRLAPGLTSDLAEHMDYLLIESLPVGWGYMHTPMAARYARNFDRPVQGMTGAFHEVWGDFGTVKHPEQLTYELSMSLAHHLPVSVGDQLRPRGELEPAKYDVVEEAFAFAKERSLPPGDPLRDIAVLVPGSTDPSGAEPIDVPGTRPHEHGGLGATKVLADTHRQFDILDEPLARELLLDSEFDTLVLPAAGTLSSDIVDTVREFVAGGGGLVATDTSSLTETESFALGDVLGIEHRGRLPYSSAYFDLSDYEAGLPDMECVSYAGFQSVALTDADERARVAAPTTERSETRRFSHHQAPPERRLDVPAITYNQYGDGTAVYLGTPLFAQYYESEYHAHRALLGNVLSDVRGGPPPYTVDAPPSVEVNGMTVDDTVYLHFTNYHTNRAGDALPQITDTVPVAGVTATLHDTPGDEVETITDASVTTASTADGLEVTIDRVDRHEIVAIS